MLEKIKSWDMITFKDYKQKRLDELGADRSTPIAFATFGLNLIILGLLLLTFIGPKSHRYLISLGLGYFLFVLSLGIMSPFGFKDFVSLFGLSSWKQNEFKCWDFFFMVLGLNFIVFNLLEILCSIPDFLTKLMLPYAPVFSGFTFWANLAMADLFLICTFFGKKYVEKEFDQQVKSDYENLNDDEKESVNDDNEKDNKVNLQSLLSKKLLTIAQLLKLRD